MEKLVYGVGINDRSYPATVNGKPVKEYSLWTSMLSRCYSEAFLRKQPTYIGCNVSEGFKHYHIFHNWCQTQIGFGVQGYHLDKDLLIKGNKIYSEDTCVFVHKSLNNLLTNRKLDRGELYVGVTKSGNNFKAHCNRDSVVIHIGTFTTPELAFYAYKEAKESYIKELAEKYKDTIDPRAYLALMNYEVHIDD